ncbi:hypothetical protein, partial [Geobacillus stearothermophilus]
KRKTEKLNAIHPPPVEVGDFWLIYVKRCWICVISGELMPFFHSAAWLSSGARKKDETMAAAKKA